MLALAGVLIALTYWRGRTIGRQPHGVADDQHPAARAAARSPIIRLSNAPLPDAPGWVFVRWPFPAAIAR